MTNVISIAVLKNGETPKNTLLASGINK